jgi:hypothetical protein
LRRDLKKAAPHVFAPAGKEPPRRGPSEALSAKPRPVPAMPKRVVNGSPQGRGEESWNEF